MNKLLRNFKNRKNSGQPRLSARAICPRIRAGLFSKCEMEMFREG